jgi:hypothetical protein
MATATLPRASTGQKPRSHTLSIVVFSVLLFGGLIAFYVALKQHNSRVDYVDTVISDDELVEIRFGSTEAFNNTVTQQVSWGNRATHLENAESTKAKLRDCLNALIGYGDQHHQYYSHASEGRKLFIRYTGPDQADQQRITYVMIKHDGISYVRFRHQPDLDGLKDVEDALKTIHIASAGPQPSTALRRGTWSLYEGTTWKFTP